MTDHDRNMRTLVACFVLAVVSLTALRFIELGQRVDSQVLGVTTAGQKKTVTLPNAELRGEVLEARYIGK